VRAPNGGRAPPCPTGGDQLAQVEVDLPGRAQVLEFREPGGGAAAGQDGLHQAQPDGVGEGVRRPPRVDATVRVGAQPVSHG
jgi:hypothetical protein